MSSHKTEEREKEEIIEIIKKIEQKEMERDKEINIDHELIQYGNIDNELHVDLIVHFQKGNHDEQTFGNEIRKKKRKDDTEFGGIIHTYMKKKIMLKVN